MEAKVELGSPDPIANAPQHYIAGAHRIKILNHMGFETQFQSQITYGKQAVGMNV